MFNNLNRIGYVFLNVFFPVFLGGIIYILFRDKDILLFEWFNYLGLSHYVLEIRSFFNPEDIVISNFLTYNLPDGLWIYSFTSCMLLIWVRNNSIHKNTYIIVPILLSLLSELGQLFNFIGGTFDFLDLMFYLFFTYLANINHKRISKCKKENS